MARRRGGGPRQCADHAAFGVSGCRPPFDRSEIWARFKEHLRLWVTLKLTDVGVSVEGAGGDEKHTREIFMSRSGLCEWWHNKATKLGRRWQESSNVKRTCKSVMQPPTCGWDEKENTVEEGSLDVKDVEESAKRGIKQALKTPVGGENIGYHPCCLFVKVKLHPSATRQLHTCLFKEYKIHMALSQKILLSVCRCTTSCSPCLW